MDKESRNAFIVIGAVLVGLLAISVVFSGRSGDAIYTGPPIHEQYQVATLPEDPAATPEDVPEMDVEVEPGAEEAVEAIEEAPAEEPVAEAPAEEAPAEEPVAEAPAEEAPAEEPVAEAPAEEAPAEEPVAEAPAEEAPQEVALAGDPAAGERVWNQCRACHQIGEGAQNRVGPQLTGIIDRPKAAVEGFNYSSALQVRGEEGGVWTVDELRGFLANPREYMPGTSMNYAGVRSEDDLENLIAYLATYE